MGACIAIYPYGYAASLPGQSPFIACLQALGDLSLPLILWLGWTRGPLRWPMVTITVPLPSAPVPPEDPKQLAEEPPPLPEPPAPPKLPSEMIPDDVRTLLYRFYADDGGLLYVGITGDLSRRLRQHEKNKEWWVSIARIEAAVYPSRMEAAFAEHDAIETENPRFNKARYSLAGHLRSQGAVR